MTDRPTVVPKQAPEHQAVPPALRTPRPEAAPRASPAKGLSTSSARPRASPAAPEREARERQERVRQQAELPDGLGGDGFPADAPVRAHIALTDAATLRQRARLHLEQGAVTHGSRGDRTHVLAVLDTALATELVCMLRYRRHHFMASGLDARGAAAEFLEHSLEEQRHADLLAARILQLGGQPDFDPDSLARRSHAQYVAGNDLVEMIREDLVAERVAIESYGEAIRSLGDDDPTTRRLLESILAVEEEHAEDLFSLLGTRHA